MRLVGLLVIVGVVAACGGEEGKPPGEDDDATHAALTMSDARALWGERERLREEEDVIFDEMDRGGDEDEAALAAWGEATEGAYRAALAICDMERAVERGDDGDARDGRRRALQELEAVRRHLDLAREALSQE